MCATISAPKNYARQHAGPAREKPIAGVSSTVLAQKISAEKSHHLPRTEALLYLKESKPTVTLTVGAGDIDQMINSVKLTLLNG